jgi:dTMP kinase
VICDRYYVSGCVYSAAKLLPNLTLSWAKAPEFGLPAPDRLIFLDISPEDAAKRGAGYGTERYEEQEMQKNVRGLFDEMLEVEKGKEHYTRIDAGESMEKVQNEVLASVMDVLIDVQEGKLGSLGVLR